MVWRPRSRGGAVQRIGSVEASNRGEETLHGLNVWQRSGRFQEDRATWAVFDSYGADDIGVWMATN